MALAYDLQPQIGTKQCACSKSSLNSACIFVCVTFKKKIEKINLRKLFDFRHIVKSMVRLEQELIRLFGFTLK